MAFPGGKVNSAAQDVEHAAINGLTLQAAEFFVKFLRRATPQIGNLPNAEIPEVAGDGLSDAGDFLEFTENFCLASRSHRR